MFPNRDVKWFVQSGSGSVPRSSKKKRTELKFMNFSRTLKVKLEFELEFINSKHKLQVSFKFKLEFIN